MAMFDSDDGNNDPETERKPVAKKRDKKRSKKKIKTTIEAEKGQAAAEPSVSITKSPSKNEVAPIVIEDPSLALGKAVSFNSNLKRRHNSFLVRIRYCCGTFQSTDLTDVSVFKFTKGLERRLA